MWSLVRQKIVYQTPIFQSHVNYNYKGRFFFISIMNKIGHIDSDIFLFLVLLLVYDNLPVCPDLGEKIENSPDTHM